jgi:hypothetical protein
MSRLVEIVALRRLAPREAAQSFTALSTHRSEFRRCTRRVCRSATNATV